MRADEPKLDDRTIDRLGEKIVEAAAAADRAIHELRIRVRRFEEAGGSGRAAGARPAKARSSSSTRSG